MRTKTNNNVGVDQVARFHFQLDLCFHFAVWQSFKGAFRIYIELRKLLGNLPQHIRSDLLAGQRM